MTSVTLDQIVFDDSIYPRAKWSQATVDRYADAMQSGDHFPPIILEAGTNRLLDGKHRTEAYRTIGRHLIAVDHHQIPDGVPAKLYAASLSSRHGDPLKAEDKRRVAREIAEASPDYSMVTIASLLGTSRQTVSKYVSDLVEHRREVRRAKAALLAQSGKSVREVADVLGVSKSEVSRNVADDISGQLTEEVLREAAAELPIDATPIVEELLRERAPAEPTSQPDAQTPESSGAGTAPPDDSGPTEETPDVPTKTVDPAAAKAAVDAALDQFVPDPGAPQRAWRKEFYDRLKPISGLTLWLKADTAAQFATDDDVETLRQLALSFTEMHRKVVAAQTAPVTALRRVK